MTCPEGRRIHQTPTWIKPPNGRYTSKLVPLIQDPTWRHSDDGTVCHCGGKA